MINQKNPSIEFNATDRCDRCPARAVSSANKERLELLFCRHHIKQYKLTLEMEGWTVSFDYVELENIEPSNVKVSA
jgi:hypothetical protein